MTIHVTEIALTHIKQTMESQKRDPHSTFLRVGVKEGTCSALEYVIGFSEKPKAQDDHEFIFRFGGAKESDFPLIVLIADKHISFLSGLTLDYHTQGIVGGFVFQNPNAEHGCGCGKSFAPKDPPK